MVISRCDTGLAGQQTGEQVGKKLTSTENDRHLSGRGRGLSGKSPRDTYDMALSSPKPQRVVGASAFN